MPVVVEDSESLLRGMTGEKPQEPQAEEPEEGAESPGEEEAEAADAGEDSRSGSADRDAEEGEKPEVDPDDVEGEDGLTPHQKAELTRSMQKAISKKHAQLREAEEFAADQYNRLRLAEERASRLERDNARLQAQFDELKKPDPEAGKPRREDFNSDETYRDAVDNWRVDKLFRQRDAERTRADTEARQQELVARAQAMAERAKELVPDWQEKIEGVDAPVPPAIAGYMPKSDKFAELGYYFAEHPERLDELGKLDPDAQLVEIGKIESRLRAFGSKDGAAVDEPSVSPRAANGSRPEKETESAGRSAATEHRAGPSSPRVPKAPVFAPIPAGTGAQVEKELSAMSNREHINKWSKDHGWNPNLRKRH